MKENSINLSSADFTQKVLKIYKKRLSVSVEFYMELPVRLLVII